jgi:hypothetical protein
LTCGITGPVKLQNIRHTTPHKSSRELSDSAYLLENDLKQCLDRRIAEMKRLIDEFSAWEQERNTIRATVRWRFNKDSARVKLQRHFSNLQNYIMLRKTSLRRYPLNVYKFPV